MEASMTHSGDSGANGRPATNAFPSRVPVCRLQLIALLLACLPNDGKSRELLEMALDLDPTRLLTCLRPPREEDAALGMTVSPGIKDWILSLWTEDMSAAERSFLWWQNTPENMVQAVAELQAVDAKLNGQWLLDWV
jgi:hypothetical protein